MNERIRELAGQAGCKVMDDGEWYIPSATGLEKIVYTKGIGLEKFAELIVRECVGLCETAAYAPRPALNPTPVEQYAFIIGEGNMAVNLAKQIRKHFGVEE